MEKMEDPVKALVMLGKEKLKHKSISQLKKEARAEIEKQANNHLKKINAL